MKRLILLTLLITSLVWFSPGRAFSQEGQLPNFDQEKAADLAQQIADQKTVQTDSGLAQISIDVNQLIDEGYSHWGNLEFDQAREKFQKALALAPYDEGISNLIFEVDKAKIVYEREKLAMAKKLINEEKKLVQDQRLLETDNAWLMKEPEGTTEPVQKSGSLNKLKDIALQKNVSVDFSNAQLREILSYLSGVSGINIIMDEEAVSRAGSLSIKLKDVSLVQALESILRTKGLGYRFEHDFIWVSTRQNIVTEDLTTRIYHLSQGLAAFTTFTTFDTVTIDNLAADQQIVTASKKEGEEGAGAKTYEGVKIGGSSGVSGKLTMTIKDVLKEIVQWPEGSSIFLDNRTSTLIVRNTPSNLAVIEQALEVLDVNPPQVMIEARFVEIGQDDFDSLGLGMTPYITAQGSASPVTYPFRKDQDTRYASGFPTPTSSDFTFGVLDFSQFQAVLSALEQNSTSNTLSSPKVTTISGQEAIIKIVKEYRYPTKFELEKFTTTDANGAEKTETFSVPADFKTRDIGIILKVTPNVGSDGRTINLTLVPEVSEFDINNDMFNYGTDANPYLQPFFNVRNATASIVVDNNDTVVMGGLMREVVLSLENKVPLLGSIPILGKLFSNKEESKEKKNLLIFVTARIIAPSGERVLSK